MGYRGRPGLSPANAALIASGALASGSLVLDAGCGTGEESVGLALEGMAVVGVDRDASLLDVARRSALGNGVGAATWFVEADVERLDETFRPRTFDAAVDVLLFNNIMFGEDGGAPAAERYLTSLARVLRPGALVSMQWRIDPDRALPATASLRVDVPPRALRHYIQGSPIATHVPVHPERRAGRSHAAVALLILRRR